MSPLFELKSHHRRFIAEFIELYKSFPTLWNIKSPEYNDREVKRAAYMNLVFKLQEVEPKANRQDVIRKINSLRSAFRREYRKVVLMKSAGRIYKPRLWYYKLIKFTVDKSEKSCLRDAVNAAGDCNEDIDSLSADNAEIKDFKEDDDDTFTEEHTRADNSSTTWSKNGEPNKPKPFQMPQDEYDAVGYNVASKLRQMDRNQRIIAERIIAETLFQGQLGALSVHSSCSDFYPTISSRNGDDSVKFNCSSSV